MDYTKIITIEPGTRGGLPCIRGVRANRDRHPRYLAGGMTEDEILADFPFLVCDDIRARMALSDERAA